MGILDDLAMGFGFKERTADYDARTARNIAKSQAAGNWGGTQGYSMSPQMLMREMKVRDKVDTRGPTITDVYGETRPSQARAYLDRAGRAGGIENYNPYPVEDDRPLYQRILTSPASPPSPRPYAIGPVQFDEPLPAFGPFGFAMGLLNRISGNEPEPKPNMLMDKGVLTETESSNDAILDRVFGEGYAERLRQVGDVEYYKQQLEEAKKFL